MFYIDDDVDVYEYTIRKPITWEQFVDSDYTQQHSDVLYNWRLEYFGSYYRVVVYHEYNGADVAILFDTYESIPLTSTDTIINGHVYRAH